ncbi:MAG: DUF3329 domain-containing protein [Devosia sp.]
MNEKDTNFFRPLWLRVLLTVAVAVWFAAEIFWSRDQFWMVLTGLALAYCVWSFFLSFPKVAPGAPADVPSPPADKDKTP